MFEETERKEHQCKQFGKDILCLCIHTFRTRRSFKSGRSCRVFSSRMCSRISCSRSCMFLQASSPRSRAMRVLTVKNGVLCSSRPPTPDTTLNPISAALAFMARRSFVFPIPPLPRMRMTPGSLWVCSDTSSMNNDISFSLPVGSYTTVSNTHCGQSYYLPMRSSASV